MYKIQQGHTYRVRELFNLCFVELQEAIVVPPWVGLAIRPRPGVWEHLRVNVDEMVVEELTVSEYLSFKECLADGQQ